MLNIWIYAFFWLGICLRVLKCVIIWFTDRGVKIMPSRKIPTLQCVHVQDRRRMTVSCMLGRNLNCCWKHETLYNGMIRFWRLAFVQGCCIRNREFCFWCMGCTSEMHLKFSWCLHHSYILLFWGRWLSLWHIGPTAITSMIRSRYL